MSKRFSKRLIAMALTVIMAMPLSCIASAASINSVKTKELVDPIAESDFAEGVLNLNEAIAAAADETITVMGQLVYRFGNYDSQNSAILEDVIDGKVVALQVYNSLDDYDIGDVVKITGKKSVYGGVNQVQNLTANEEAADASLVPLIPAAEYETFADLKADYDSKVSQYVVVKNVTLGTYNANGSTVVTDSTGATMNIYRAATYPTGVEAGEVVNLYACASKYNTTQQLRVGSSKDYRVANDTKAPSITVPEFYAAELGVDYTVSIEATDNVGVTSMEMTYTIGETPKTVPMEYNEATGKFSYTIPGAEITSSSAISLSFTAKDEAGNSKTETGTVTVNDKPRVVAVTPASSSATNEDKRPVISAEFENAGENPTVVMTVNGEAVTVTVKDNKATYTPAENMEDGKYSVVVTITREDGASAEYKWTFTVGESQYQIYAGQIHSHTAQFSDGSGTLKDAYDHVLGLNEKENVDFLAVTDHSNYFDSKDNLGDITDASSGNGNWALAQQITDEYNEKQDKIPFIYGYEMTWSGGPGHMNTFNTEGFVSRNDSVLNNKTADAGMKAYYELLKTVPQSISQFNHPGTTFGTFADFAYWDPAIDAQISLVEVGNGEGAIGGSSYFPSYEYYTLALDKGWHVAPTNNQDNHKGKWGNANTARTCIITDDFTEEGIYAALKDMRVYSTEDKNLEIFYYLNDAIMGSSLKESPEKVHIYSTINDPDGENIGTVSVIVNGGLTVWTQDYKTSSAVVDVTLPNTYSYYYIKVQQPDGEIAVTAPVWTSDVLKIGITSVESSAIIPVVGEELTLTTSLFNYESTDMEVESIVYSVDNDVIDTVTGIAAVPASTESTTEFKFTPSKVGLQTINITVNAKQDGTPYTFTYNLDLDVLDPSELIDVAIDAGHKNFYISGNYSGSDAALIELFAQNAIRTHYIEEDITYDAIKDMKILILTVPFISYGTSVADYLYTDSELDAIAEYASNGGNIILCSKSDRGNPEAEAEHASTISNQILEAIGAGSRVADGIVVDNERKENEAFRLYFTEEGNYNYDSPFTQGILETTNNSFSCYNGAPIILGENATALVKGYDTTWGASFTDNFGGDSKYVPNYDSDTVVVPKGDVTVMASEDLSGGGWLLVSGVTFFSTFEVKVEVENSTTLQNSNYQIVMNIIEQIIPEPIITAIADVIASAKEAMGKKFTIEGIVTSNASGYDKETAFFDCIYAQDDTAGINLFPVAGDYRIGQKVRVTGITGSYNGELELVVSKIKLVDDSITEVKPLAVSAADAMSDKYIGSLLQVKGTVSKVLYASDGTLETIMVKDENGDEARVFIDGYIMSTYTGLDNIKVGDGITAVGLGSVTVDTEAATPVYLHRLRVRNRSEIVLTPSDFLKGDADMDGTLTMRDVVGMQRAIAEIETFTDKQKEIADMNNDGILTMIDVVELQKLIASL